MWYLQLFILSLMQCCILTALPLYFSNIHITKKNIVQALLFIVIPSIILLVYMDVYAIIYVTLAIGYFIYRLTKKWFYIMHVLVTIFICVLADHMASLIVNSLLNDMMSNVIAPTVQLFVFLFMTALLALIYKHLLRLFEDIFIMNYYSVLIIILLLILTLIFMYTNILAIEDTMFLQSVQQNLFFFAIYVVILFILISLVIYMTIKRMQITQKEKELESFKTYVASLEQINQDMRKFKHDYMNILTTMRHFIDDKNYDGLESYFYMNILHTEQNEELQNIALSMLNRLEVASLKGLLTTKLLQAQAQEVQMQVEIVEPIDSIPVNDIQLNRMCGIIIDNAIEASIQTVEPMVRLAFIQLEESILFVCMNNYDTATQPDLKIHKIYQESFSTKAKGRGLGLSILRQIVNESPNLRLNTKIQDDLFVQELFIDKE